MGLRGARGLGQLRPLRPDDVSEAEPSGPLRGWRIVHGLFNVGCMGEREPDDFIPEICPGPEPDVGRRSGSFSSPGAQVPVLGIPSYEHPDS